MQYRRYTTIYIYETFVHIVGVCGELHVKSDTQTKRLENILKDSPQKYSLRREGLRLEPIPSLDVVQDCDPYDDHTLTENWERRGEGGYQPGSNNKGSLKRDGNVVPLHSQRSRSYSDGWRKSHDHNFRYPFLLQLTS